MLSRLPESRRVRERRPAVLVTSAAIHLLLGALAIAGTMRAETPPPAEPDEYVRRVFVPPREPGRASPDRPSAGERRSSVPAPALAGPVLTAPIDIPLGVPAVDFGAVPTADDFRAGSGGLDAGISPSGALGSGEPFGVSDVERPVILLPGTLPPRYPERLRAGGIEGRVVMRFVVDTAGRVEPGSVRTVEGDHELFVSSVRDALPRMRFAPAEAGGRRVRQLVEQSFQFSLNR